jgi:SAM-dependent methyltransferase
MMSTTPTQGLTAQAYDDKFYGAQVEGALCSARLLLAHLWKYHRSDSVLDVGCGRGAWLKACHELGSTNLSGLDGHWNTQEMMIDDAITFKNIDLNQPFVVPQTFDLAISVEVAEHLEPTSATQFVESLTRASDTVLFSAAYTRQGGVCHINEQPHTYWATLFLSLGYVPFDLFRPLFWGDDRVLFWYRQNTFLYVKKESASYSHLLSSGLAELAHISFMDCIHPDLYAAKLNADFKEFCKRYRLPSFIRAMHKRSLREKLRIKHETK